MAPWNLLLAECEEAGTRQECGAFLRWRGPYFSQMTEWRKRLDAEVLAGKKPGVSIVRLTAEQAAIARLRRRLEMSGNL